MFHYSLMCAVKLKPAVVDYNFKFHFVFWFNHGFSTAQFISDMAKPWLASHMIKTVVFCTWIKQKQSATWTAHTWTPVQYVAHKLIIWRSNIQWIWPPMIFILSNGKWLWLLNWEGSGHDPLTVLCRDWDTSFRIATSGHGPYRLCWAHVCSYPGPDIIW